MQVVIPWNGMAHSRHPVGLQGSAMLHARGCTVVVGVRSGDTQALAPTQLLQGPSASNTDVLVVCDCRSSVQAPPLPSSSKCAPCSPSSFASSWVFLPRANGAAVQDQVGRASSEAPRAMYPCRCPLRAGTQRTAAGSAPRIWGTGSLARKSAGPPRRRLQYG